MTRTAGAIALLLSLCTLAWGQVDKAELDKAQGANVKFTDYVGPHSRIDTVEQIVSIGQGLGKAVTDKPAEIGGGGKYRLIHAVGPAEGTKLDADIFVIEPTAEVDAVVNVMRMVSGYLQAAYSYSAADAMVLARFVVYYNAVYRGNLDYLGGAYKSVVMKYLTAENAGIGTKYTDWPGKTRMVIPLSSAKKGSLDAVTGGELGGSKVVENLQQQEDKGLGDRKDLTELQQRSLEQGQQQAADQQAQLDKDKAQLALQQAAADAARKAADEAAANATTDAQKQAAAQAEADAKAKEAAAAAQADKVAQEEQAAAQKQADLAAQQKALADQRETIAADEQAVIKQKEEQAGAGTTAAGSTAAPGKVLFLYGVAAGTDKLGKLVLIERVSGKLLTQSDLNTVRNRAWVTLGSSIVVVAGSTGGNAAVRLVSVDPSTLAVTQTGKDNLAPTSFLAATDTAAYAVLQTAKGTFLGRFDQSLALQAQSERAVDASTYIVVSGTEVFVQDGSGNILILDKDDLKEKKRNG